MSLSTTIIFARANLSIPGAHESAVPMANQADAMRRHFFDLLERSQPDVIVLDYSGAPTDGIDTVFNIRRGTGIPILLVCDPTDSRVQEYRIAGANDCVPSPVDILSLNQAIRRIMFGTRRDRAFAGDLPEKIEFAGISFYPRRNRLVSEEGLTVALTNSEGRLLTLLVSTPWTLHTRSDIAALLYGPEHVVGDRAIDVVVNRLRNKLILAGGPGAEYLIRTEFRRGYLLATDVATMPYTSVARPRALLEPDELSSSY
jgi:two-component system, OmpR family, response regulator